MILLFSGSTLVTANYVIYVLPNTYFVGFIDFSASNSPPATKVHAG